MLSELPWQDEYRHAIATIEPDTRQQIDNRTTPDRRNKTIDRVAIYEHTGPHKFIYPEVIDNVRWQSRDLRRRKPSVPRRSLVHSSRTLIRAAFSSFPRVIISTLFRCRIGIGIEDDSFRREKASLGSLGNYPRASMLASRLVSIRITYFAGVFRKLEALNTL